MAKYPIPYTFFAVSGSQAFPKGRQAPRPVLGLALINGTRRLNCVGIVDSGADYCVFPRSFMPALEISPLSTPSEPGAGVGSYTLTHFHNVTMDFGVLRIPVYAGFTDGLDHWGVGLLGQSSFFDRFKIHFDLPGGIFEIET